MPTRMIHPKHGAMHAYGTGEIERLEGLGWAVEAISLKVSDDAPPANVAVAIPINQGDPADIRAFAMAGGGIRYEVPVVRKKLGRPVKAK